MVEKVCSYQATLGGNNPLLPHLDTSLGERLKKKVEKVKDFFQPSPASVMSTIGRRKGQSRSLESKDGSDASTGKVPRHQPNPVARLVQENVEVVDCDTTPVMLYQHSLAQ